jgi:hypothetical protein
MAKEIRLKGLSDEVAPGRRLHVEPEKIYDFDMPKEMMEKVMAEFDLNKLAQSLRGTDQKDISGALTEAGRKLMEIVIEAADTKYKDRTGDMLETVAKQTGVWFPHPVERYIELSLLSLRPEDKWNVTLATTKELCLQVYTCSIYQTLKDVLPADMAHSCGVFCLSSFSVAGEKVGLKISSEQTKFLPRDSMCEYRIRPGA